MLDAVAKAVFEGTCAADDAREVGIDPNGERSASFSSPKSKKSAVEVGTIFERLEGEAVPVVEVISNKSAPLPTGLNMDGLTAGENGCSTFDWVLVGAGEGIALIIGVNPESVDVSFVGEVMVGDSG